jgi:hypothetical protein
MRFFQYAARGKGGSQEPVHPDHISYYSFSTLNLVIKRENLRVENFYFYDLGREHRVFNPWYYNFANDFCVKLSPQLADGIIAVCGLEKS